MNLQPLLAADLIQTIFGIIVFVIWIAGQFMGSREQAKRNKKPKPPRQQGPAAPADAGVPGVQPPKQGPRNQEDELRSEVEEFLRRAQGKPAQAQPVAEQKRRALSPGMPPPQRESRQQPQSPAAQQRKRGLQTKPLAAGQEGAIRKEGVAEHVQRHLSTEDIADHTKTLGAKIATADDRVEARLEDKFEHTLGRLEHREAPAEPKEVTPDMAADLAEMLSKPNGIKQLIIANEILRRPEW